MGLARVEKYLKPCLLCGACYGRGPNVPHNWREPNPEPAPERRCPSLDFFKFRTYGAMDRISLATIVKREEYPLSDDLKKVFYSCTLCGACTEVCGLYDPVDIIRAAREEIVERSAPLAGHRKLLEGFAKHGNPWQRPNSEREAWSQGLGFKDIAGDGCDTLFFAGCTASLRPELGAMARSAASLILQAGVEMGTLGTEEKCCGYVPRTVGHAAGFEELARENISTFKKLGIRRIVTVCPGCKSTFKAYPLEEAGIEVLHTLEYVQQLIGEGKIKPGKKAGLKVTYHDPCELGRSPQATDVPRGIMEAMPGVQLVEMERHGRWTYCCGAGGQAYVAYPGFASAVAKERVAEARDTGAQVLATSCPMCLTTLRAAAAKKGPGGLRVVDLLSFLQEAK